MKNIESQIKSIERKAKINRLIYIITAVVIIAATLYLLKKIRKKDDKITEWASEFKDKELEAKNAQALYTQTDSLLDYIAENPDYVNYDSIRVAQEKIKNSGYDQGKDTTSINSKYLIRFYSYNPNERTKKEIADNLRKEGFNIKVYPNWKNKPGFFSDESTVLYYSADTKDKATEIAENLSKEVKQRFRISKGTGAEIKEEERENIFIIHYLEKADRRG